MSFHSEKMGMKCCDKAKSKEQSPAVTAAQLCCALNSTDSAPTIDPNLNPQTRTVPVRIELENPGQVLKIGMYVNAAFGSLGNAESTAPVIPSSAVQSIDNRQLVVVATDKPNVFILRFVRLGTERNGKYIVHEGLNVGDKIVNDGSFSLRAEWLKQHPDNQ